MQSQKGHPYADPVSTTSLRQPRNYLHIFNTNIEPSASIRPKSSALYSSKQQIPAFYQKAAETPVESWDEDIKVVHNNDTKN
jgi:hypothetical protein